MVSFISNSIVVMTQRRLNNLNSLKVHKTIEQAVSFFPFNVLYWMKSPQGKNEQMKMNKLACSAI